MDWRRSLRRVFLNPLVTKDGLSRMRSWRAPGAIALYLGLLGGFGVLVLRVALGAGGQSGGYTQSGGYAQIGSAVFTAMAMLQLALVCLFSPAVAAGAVSAERERQTLDVLLVSGVSPLSLVWGKLVASVAFILLLVGAAQPLFATIFLFGGIDFQQFAIAQLLTATTALAAAAVSLLFSVLFRRTLLSTVAAYAATFAGTVGTWVLGVILTIGAASQRTGFPELNPLMLFNPIQAMLMILQVPVIGVTVPAARRSTTLYTGLAGLVVAPPVEPWMVTVAAESVLVILCAAAAVLLLRGQRPMPWSLEPRVEPVHPGVEPQDQPVR